MVLASSPTRGASVWTEIASPAQLPLNGVRFSNRIDGWVVGDLGTILRLVRGVWQNYPSGSDQDLRAVTTVSDGEAWAVGVNGVILHFDGTIWAPHGQSGQLTLLPLNAVAFLTPDIGWAVGGDVARGGIALRYNGTSWVSATTTIDALNDVEVQADNNVIFCGDRRRLMRFDGTRFALQASPLADGLAWRALSLPFRSFGWVVGDRGTIATSDTYSSASGVWTLHALSGVQTRASLRDVSLMPGVGSGYIVGTDGVRLPVNGGGVEPLEASCEGDLRSVHVVNDLEGAAVGTGAPLPNVGWARGIASTYVTGSYPVEVSSPGSQTVPGARTSGNLALAIAISGTASAAVAVSPAAGTSTDWPDLGVGVRVLETPPCRSAGQSVLYQIIVTNTGLVTIDALTVTDTVSPLITGITPFQPAPFAPPTVTAGPAGPIYAWSASGLTLAPAAFSTSATSFSLTFTLTGADSLGCVSPGLALDLAQTAGCGARADPLVYRLTVRNVGTATIDDLTVVDTLPDAWGSVVDDTPVPFTLARSPQGSATVFGWNATALGFAPGAWYTFTLTGSTTFGSPVRRPRVLTRRAVTAESDVSNARVFPNPFDPSRGDVLKLDRLPSDVTRIEFFTLRGERIADLVRGVTYEPVTGVATWPGRASSGKPVATGSYVWRVATRSGRARQGVVLVVKP